MEWIRTSAETGGLPIKSWCATVEDGAMVQALNLARHPALRSHVALMPDCHVGFGMPIGGVVAADAALIPNAVGVDIGCGMVAVHTSLAQDEIGGKSGIRAILNAVRETVPLGEGRAHRSPRRWEGFERFADSLRGAVPAWMGKDAWDLDKRNLGSLGGGNHFIEIQADQDGAVWLMIHSGSRNLGHRIATHYHKRAQAYCAKLPSAIAPSPDLAHLPDNSPDGAAYRRDMEFALAYAMENRRRMMNAFKEALAKIHPDVVFLREVNIHHNYAAPEAWNGQTLWIHRKGATSARRGETGIIPGSMGTPSYIVNGLGNPESFQSCSHGAGRSMGRSEACRRLDPAACDAAMGEVVYDRWRPMGARGRRKASEAALDLSEAPLAYKDIEAVISSQADLASPINRLIPLGVLKG